MVAGEGSSGPPGLASPLEIMLLAAAGPAGRHPATLGALLLVAGHLAHLYQDTVQAGRQAATAINSFTSLQSSDSKLSDFLIKNQNSF